MDIVPYERSHLDTFVPGPWDADSTKIFKSQKEWEGKAVSIQKEGRTLAIVAIALPAKTAALSALLSEEMRVKHPIALCRIAKASLPGIMELPGVEGISVEVDFEFKEARRWAEWLGFVGRAQNKRWLMADRTMKWQPKHS